MRPELSRPGGGYRPCAAACGTWLDPSEPPSKRYCSTGCRQRGYLARQQTSDAPRTAPQDNREASAGVEAQRQARFRDKLRMLAIQPEQLRSGNFHDVCPDCGMVTIARSAEELDGARCACPPTRYEYVVQLDCSLCARPVASIRVPMPRARIVLLRQVRCPVCGGAAVQGEAVRVAVAEPITFRAQPVRRGRPPKWLVEQRRMQAMETA